jgi:hypothetical protein
MDHPQDFPEFQTAAEPLWKLAILFDALILHPTTPTDPHPDATVMLRLAAFRRGDIQSLHEQASAIAPPSNTNPPTFANIDKPCPTAQALANEDNLRSAY